MVSDAQLVANVPAPGAAELGPLLAHAEALVDGYEAEGVVLIADFEGEMPGYGGEVVTAAFLPTAALDPQTLRRCLAGSQPTREVPTGLLVDLRCAAGINLVRRIMQSQAITKLIWGADMDMASLRYQELPRTLGIGSASVVDVQLGFSTPERRLGMARALERVPHALIEGLPGKKTIDFDTPHSRNRRALRFPLGDIEARYAADDLHRIEAILSSQVPDGGSYVEARRITEDVARALESDPAGLVKLESDLKWFAKMSGTRRQKRAVEIARHVVAVRARGAASGDAELPCARALEQVSPVLAKAGVIIPHDLGFAD